LTCFLNLVTHAKRFSTICAKKGAQLLTIAWVQLLEAELKPQLVEMQQELEDYKAYQKAAAEVDTLEPLIRAYEYYTLRTQHDTLTARVADAETQEEDLLTLTETTKVGFTLLLKSVHSSLLLF
jgi:hypothetical protein